MTAGQIPPNAVHPSPQDVHAIKPIYSFYASKPILTANRIWHIFRPMSDLARDPGQIGNLIRRARKRQGLSQQALGDKVGLRQETVSLIENGNPATRLETLLAVVAALDLELQIAARSKGGFGLDGDF
jgi:HTH-type transcriptional regulator / antitoxin HipB